MSFCPNKNLPEFKEMSSIFGEEMATRLWVSNKGFPLTEATNGEPSKLFQQFINDGLTREEALKYKARLHTVDFITQHGDWRKATNQKFSEKQVNQILRSSPEILNSVYEAENLDAGGRPFEIKDSGKDFNLSDEELSEVHANYLSLMNRQRAGKGLNFKEFKRMFENTQVYRREGTYMFGQWDRNNLIFQVQLISSPDQRKLFTAIKTLMKQGNMAASVPADVGANLKKMGFYKIAAGHEHDFRGEKMVKHLYFQSKEMAEKVFKTPAEDITSEQVKEYDNYFNRWGLIFQLKKDFDAGNMDKLLPTLKKLGIYDKNALAMVRNLKASEGSPAKVAEAVKLLLKLSANNMVNIEAGDRLNNPAIYEDLNTDLNKTLATFLSKFGIKTEVLEDMQNEMGTDAMTTVDVLNKIISTTESGQETYPEEAGKLIAFMMQHNPLVGEILNDFEKFSLFKGLVTKEEKLAAVGELIAEELHNRTETPIPQSLAEKIRNLIRQFFDLLPSIRMKRVNRNVGIIADNILIQNQALITASTFKPGAEPLNAKDLVTKRVSKVSLEEGLKSDPFATDIVDRMAESFILTGSVTLAEQGTIFRPQENQVHDLDWVSPVSRQQTKEKFTEMYPNSVFIREIENDEGYTTDTWLVVPDGYKIVDLVLTGPTNRVDGYKIKDPKGNIVSTYVPSADAHISSVGTGDIGAKLIDIFSYASAEDQASKILSAEDVTLASGATLKIANWKDTFGAKLAWSRLKDLWDYNRFIPEDNKYSQERAKELYVKYRKKAISTPGSEEDVAGFKEYILKGEDSFTGKISTSSPSSLSLDENGEPIMTTPTPDRLKTPEKQDSNSSGKKLLTPIQEKERLLSYYNANHQGFIKAELGMQARASINTYNRRVGGTALVLERKGTDYKIKTVSKNFLQQMPASKAPANIELNKKLTDFLSKFGITVEHLQTLTDRVGTDAVGAADIINKLILISEGKEDITTLPEETAHFAIELLGDSHPLVVKMLENIEDHPIYAEVLQDYEEMYEGDLNKVRKEAAGKLLAEAIIAKDEEIHAQTPNTVLGTLTALWNKFLDFFKSMKSSDVEEMVEDVYGKVANKIFNEELSDFNVENLEQAEIYFQAKTVGTFRDAQTLKVLRESLEKQRDAIRKRIAIFKNSGKTAFIEKEKNLLAELDAAYEEKKHFEGVTKFVDNVHTELSALLPTTKGKGRLQELKEKVASGEDLNINEVAGTLKSMRNFFAAYKPIIAELKSELDSRALSEETEEQYKELKPLLDHLASNIATVESEYLKIAAPLIANAFEPFLGDRGRDKNGDPITVDLIETLTQPQKDIGMVTRILNPLAETGDDILKIIDKVVKGQKHEARLRVNKLKNDLLQAQNELEAAGYKDTDWMYERQNGELTGRYISDINYGAYLQAKKDFFTSIGKKPAEGSSELKVWKKKVQAWYKANMEDSPNARTIIDKRKKELEDNEYALWYAENFRTDKHTGDVSYENKGELRQPKAAKYSNKAFRNMSPAQKKYYDKLIAIKEKMDSRLPRKLVHERLRAPQIRKDWYERVKEGQGLITTVVEGAKETATRLIDDDEFGVKSDITDERGRSVNFVPTYYINPIKDVNKNLSTSSTDTMLLYANMAENYHAMNKVINILEVSKDLVEQRGIIKTDAEGNPVTDVWKQAQAGIKSVTQDTSSNTYERLQDYYTMVVYGQIKKDEGKLWGTNLDQAKTIDAFGRYVAVNNLAINVFSGISNLTFGGAMIRTEAFAGEFIDNKDLREADSIYRKALPSLMGEIGQRQTKSKLGLWIEMTDTLQDFDYKLRDVDSKRKTKMGQMAKSSSLYFMNQAGEHWMQTRMSLALANRIKLKDADGNEINLYDAYEVKGNNLQLKKGLTKVEDGKAFTEGDLIKHINRTNFLNKRLHGIYNDIDKSTIQRYSLGRMALMFRKFIVPGVNRRFEAMAYNEEGEAWTEGYYRTAGKFMLQTVTDLRKMQFSLVQNFKDLNETEKRNMMRAATEVGYVIASAVLAAVLSNLADDDDDNWALVMAAYQANRMYSELRFYSSPFGEGLTILKSPAAGVSSIQNIIDFLEFWDWTDTLSTGRYSGMTKFSKGVVKIVPLAKTIHKAFTPEEELLYFTKN